MGFRSAVNEKNIILLGFMGTGKTAAGRIVAGLLGREFLDMDAEIEARAGKSVAGIFAENGEPAFRAMERQLVVELAGRRSLVIAAGGGVVLDERNIRDLAGSGTLIRLDAGQEEIIRRIGADNTRPLLDEGNRAGKIAALLQSRKKAYERIPNRIDTTGLSPQQVADRILAAFQTSR